jgi:hypothetical protein
MTKTNKVIYYVLMVLVSALFLFTAYAKLTGDAQQIAGFAQAHLSIWFMYFIGACELLGVIGLWIPKLQKWAVWGLMIIMVGAIVTTAIFVSVAMAILPLVVGVLLYFINCLGKKRGMVASAAPAPAAMV